MKPAGAVRKDDTFMGVRPCLFGKEHMKGPWESGRGRRRESMQQRGIALQQRRGHPWTTTTRGRRGEDSNSF